MILPRETWMSSKHASVLEGMNPRLIKQFLLLIPMGLQTYMEEYDFNNNLMKTEGMGKSTLIYTGVNLDNIHQLPWI